MTAANVKQEVERRTGIPVARQRLLFDRSALAGGGPQVLDDDDPVYDVGFYEELFQEMVNAGGPPTAPTFTLVVLQ